MIGQFFQDQNFKRFLEGRDIHFSNYLMAERRMLKNSASESSIMTNPGLKRTGKASRQVLPKSIFSRCISCPTNKLLQPISACVEQSDKVEKLIQFDEKVQEEKEKNRLDKLERSKRLVRQNSLNVMLRPLSESEKAKQRSIDLNRQEKKKQEDEDLKKLEQLEQIQAKRMEDQEAQERRRSEIYAINAVMQKQMQQKIAWIQANKGISS